MKINNKYTVFSIVLIVVQFCLSTLINATEISKEQQEALKLTPDIENGKKVYKKCAICHGSEAWGTPHGHYPQLAGQHKNVVIKQLADIRAGNRDNPTMYPFSTAESMGNTQCIADVAAYIEKLPMNPRNEIGFGHDLIKGKQIYTENCVKCHGQNGEGSNEEFYPRLQGQSYHYMLRQMRWIQRGKRRNVDKTMVQQIHDFTGRDITAVIDYCSRLKPNEKLLAKPDWKNPDFNRSYRSASQYRQQSLPK